jgi:hypothetical protein
MSTEKFFYDELDTLSNWGGIPNTNDLHTWDTKRSRSNAFVTYSLEVNAQNGFMGKPYNQ